MRPWRHTVNRNRILMLALTIICGLVLSQTQPLTPWGQEKSDKPLVYLLDVDGSINPAVLDYITKGIEKATAHKAACLVIRLDTPGGVVTTTKSIIKEMTNAKIPVVVYVAPSGSSASSAGTFITMTADVAAMAPGTNIGAAHPVASGGQDIPQTMSEKVVNDLTAFLRGLVAKKGRNAEWAEKSIRESVSITAKEALEIKAIDLISPSVPDLLTKIDGRTIDKDGHSYTLHTKDARIERILPGWRFKILDVVANPNVASLLMMGGIIGLLAEFYSPGLIFPGVVGAICLALAAFAFQVLPVSYVGIVLIILAIIFFILELKVQSYGMLGVSAIISLTLGLIMLFETEEAAMQVSWSVIIPIVLTATLFFGVVLGLIVRARLSKPRTGEQGLRGEVGIALTDINAGGRVAVHGEFWNARADRPIAKGERVRVIGVESLSLVVTREVSG
jgi:membrane-bound serine protease (ClpP class)